MFNTKGTVARARRRRWRSRNKPPVSGNANPATKCLSARTLLPCCKFQSENVPEYKTKNGEKSRGKVYHCALWTFGINHFLMIYQSFTDRLPQGGSLTHSELAGTRLL